MTSSLSSKTFSQRGTFGGGISESHSSTSRRLYNYSFGGGGPHHHHASGEVMGSSPRDGRLSWRHRGSHSNLMNMEASLRSSAGPSMSPVPPPPPMPSPPVPSSSGRVRKKRSSTWDSSGMGRLSPKLLGKSQSYDDGPTPPEFEATPRVHDPEATVRRPQGGNMLVDLSKFALGDDLPDIFSSESESSHGSSSYSSSDESKEEETKCEIQELRTGLSPVQEVKNEEDPVSPGRGGILKNAKGVGSSSSETCSSNKSVKFQERVTRRPSSFGQRPTNLAKLPTFTEWEEGSDGESGSGADAPFAHPAKRGARPLDPSQRQNSSLPTLSLFAKLNPFGDVSWRLIGACIIRTAPCFWCSKKLGISATDREVLMRLNFLCAFFCVVQICYGVFLLIISIVGSMEAKADESRSKSEEEQDGPLVSPDLWSLEFFIFCLSLVNLILFASSLLAQRAIREVNLVRSVRFMWVLLWLLPIQIFFMIGLFDVHDVNEVRVIHSWDEPSFRLIRRLYCEPGTSDGQCKVPILGGEDFPDETKWCQAKYNATNCKEIRDNAQGNYNVTARAAHTVNAIWALLLVIIMWTTLCVLQAVITLPIVQRSKESNIPLWLTLPTAGCYFVGYLLHFAEGSVTEEVQDMYWIALTYFVSGGAFTLAALIGYVLKFYSVLNGRQKKIKQGVVIAFLVTIVLTLFAVGTIFVTSLIYSLRIVDLPFAQRGEIACELDQNGSCTGCNESDDALKCPEWSYVGVMTVLQTSKLLRCREFC
ncbi:hypothetical protein ACHAWF_005649 [Thalassiosira exigua]